MTVLVTAATLMACVSQPQPPAVDLATAASIKDSGLVAALAEAYADARLHVHAAGSDRALQMLADGIVDAAITNAPDAELRALHVHRDWAYEKIAYNRFVIVGPPEDPAQVRDASDAVDALRRIAASPMPFFSRGDRSGVNEREMALWKAAGRMPAADRLIVTGTAMPNTLKAADERQGYTLCDRSTLAQAHAHLDLVVLFERDDRLLDAYAVVYPAENAAADAFAQWLTRGKGRDAIAAFAAGDTHPFLVWPEACPGGQPEATPCG